MLFTKKLYLKETKVHGIHLSILPYLLFTFPQPIKFVLSKLPKQVSKEIVQKLEYFLIEKRLY